MRNSQIVATLLFGAVLLAALPAIVAAEDNTTGDQPVPSLYAANGNATAPATATAIGGKARVKETAKERLSEIQARQVTKITGEISRAIEQMERAVERIGVNGTDISNLTAMIAAVKEKQAAFSNSTTLTEARAALKEIKDGWKELLKAAREKAQEAAKKKTAAVIERAKGLFTKLDALIEKLAAKGYDTTQLKADVDAAKQNVAEAEGKYGTSVSEAAHLLKDANKALSDFKRDLREAARSKANATEETKANATEETEAAQGTVSPSPSAEASATPASEATPTPTPTA